MSRLNDDDLAPLIPSKSSSFNLVDDAENLKSSGSGGLSNHHNRKRSNEQDESAYFHRSGSAKLSTIAGSSSFQSVESKNTNKSHASRSGRSSSRRKKLRREEKRRQWLKRWRRRRLIGTITLSFIYTLLGAYTILVTAGPLVLQYWIDPMDWCPTYPEEFGEENLLQKTSKDIHEEDNVEDKGTISSKYENPDYNDSPCHITRIPLLLHLTLEECDLSRRMFTSVLLGGLVGYERRASDRPAGIRTMALVSLGSCFFTISSMLAFRASPMNWDSSRVSAAIPSGVGFLGAGLIWKGTLKDGSGAEVHQVHGITTAASVWLSAAIGVGAGGALYAVSAYSTALVILVLRFGPRLYLASDKGFEEDEEEESDEEEDEIDNDYDHNQESDDVRNNSEVDKNATQSPSYEMQLRDTEALKRDEKDSYGATSMEVDSIAHLLMQEQQRQVERLNSQRGNDLGEGAHSNPFFGWLGNLISENKKDRQQPHNPYREIYNDREVMKMIKKKKSMSTIKSRPSFCT